MLGTHLSEKACPYTLPNNTGDICVHGPPWRDRAPRVLRCSLEFTTLSVRALPKGLWWNACDVKHVCRYMAGKCSDTIRLKRLKCNSKEITTGCRCPVEVYGVKQSTFCYSITGLWSKGAACNDLTSFYAYRACSLLS